MARRWRALVVALFAVTLSAVASGAIFVGRVYADTLAPHVHIVSFGLWGDHDLFKREAVAAAEVVARAFGTGGQLIVRANSLASSAGRIPDLRDTLHGLASTIDVNQDVLFLILSSHGSEEGLGVKTSDNKRVFLLTPERLDGMLRVAGFRHRVVIVSACYAGVFADQMAGDNTLVITAADAQHASFGCSDDNTGNWTYFGEAFFADHFKRGRSLDETFALAKARIAEREMAEQLEHSNPQMKGGAAVIAQLRRIQETRLAQP